MSKLRIMYANLNSYTPRKHLINNILERHEINCALFVETKTKENTNTKYRNWDIIHRNGIVVNKNTRGGSLIQTHPGLRMTRENPPKMNNPLNEATHFSIPFLEDKFTFFWCIAIQILLSNKPSSTKFASTNIP